MTCKLLNLKRLAGVGLGLVSPISSTFVFAASKLSGVQPVTFMYCTSLLLLFYYSSMRAYQTPDRRKNTLKMRIILMIRCLLAPVQVVIVMTAYQYAEFSSVTALSVLTPLWVLIFDSLVHRRLLDKLSIVIVVMTITGVVMVSRPSFIFGIDPEEEMKYAKRWLGLLLAVVSSMTLAMVNILSCMISNLHQMSTTFMGLHMFGLLISVIPAAVSGFEEISCGLPRSLILCGFGLRMLVEMSFHLSTKLENPNVIATIWTIEITTSFCVDALIMKNNHFPWPVIVGSVLIFASIVTISVQKLVKSKDEIEMVDSSSNNSISDETEYIVLKPHHLIDAQH